MVTTAQRPAERHRLSEKSHPECGTADREHEADSDRIERLRAEGPCYEIRQAAECEDPAATVGQHRGLDRDGSPLDKVADEVDTVQAGGASLWSKDEPVGEDGRRDFLHVFRDDVVAPGGEGARFGYPEQVDARPGLAPRWSRLSPRVWRRSVTT